MNDNLGATNAEIIEWLKLDSPSDSIITMISTAAVGHIEKVLGYTLQEVMEKNNGQLPADVKMAQLLLCGHFYENRMAETKTVSKEMEIGVSRILQGHKKYTLA